MGFERVENFKRYFEQKIDETKIGRKLQIYIVNIGWSCREIPLPKKILTLTPDNF